MSLFWLAAFCVAFVATQIGRLEYRLGRKEKQEEELEAKKRKWNEPGVPLNVLWNL